MRWYCVSANPFQTEKAADTLRARQFAVLLPKLIFLTPKKLQLKTKPLFGVYFFVQFDINDWRWRDDIWYAPHVKRIMASGPESPIPLPEAYITALLRRLDDNHCLDQRPPAPEDIIGSTVSFEKGGRVLEGVCTDSVQHNVKVLIQILGGDREVIIDRDDLIKVQHAAS
jgi:transcription antitermination factor NusG